MAEDTKTEENFGDLLDTVSVEEPTARHGGLTHRYVCPACTGVAYYSKGVVSAHEVSNCANCGMTLSTLEKGNFIELTDAQKDALKAQGF